ncbi:MAG: hypothetical protein J3K34DRAFT_461379 [Monoraphidium minutum]|nr:MAG: hypothetical protein J3K34DRAFT_461379 [Monoraphidium minutum]
MAQIGAAEGAEGGGVATGGARLGPGVPHPLKVHWSPERAAAGAAAQDVSPAGIRTKICALTQSLGPLLMRVRHNAYNRDAALARLEAVRSEGLEFAVLIRSDAAAEPVLDTHLTPVSAAPEDGFDPAAPPPPFHFCWAVEQMQLTPEQARARACARALPEELIAVHLGAWKARSDAITARRAALLALCREAADVGEREALVKEVEHLQTIYMLVHAVYDIGFNDSLITAEQFAALLLAAFPYIPSPPALYEAVCQLRPRPALWRAYIELALRVFATAVPGKRAAGGARRALESVATQPQFFLARGLSRPPDFATARARLSSARRRHCLFSRLRPARPLGARLPRV